MAYAKANRVFETTTTTGTGSLNLAGAATGFQTFVDGIGNGNTCHYEINNGTDWEVGIGTVTAGSPDVLSRDTVIESTNADAKVNWGSGTKNVFVVFAAQTTAETNADNTFSGNNTFSGGNTFSGSNNFSSGSMTLPSATIALFATAAQGALADTAIQSLALAQISLQSAVATTSGTSVDLSTSIPSTVKRITIALSQVSTNGTSPLLIQVGNGSFVTTGYTGSTSWGTTVTNNSNGITADNNMSAALLVDGVVTLISVGGNKWIASVVSANDGGATSSVGAGSITLSSALDRIRITTAGGVNTFDAGSAIISFEY